MQPLAIIILAAGLGKRMGQSIPKVTTRTYEKSLLEHVLKSSQNLRPERLVIVTGYREDLVKETLTNSCIFGEMQELIRFAHQAEQKGTGDAVRAALPELKGFSGPVMILYGDVPLLKDTTLAALLQEHQEMKATMSLISLKGHYNNRYGRIVRDQQGRAEKIVEYKDCSPEELLLDETNSGIYLVDSAFLGPAVEGLSNDNAQGEYYLTDILERCVKEGQTVHIHPCFDAIEVQGVNTRDDLQLVNKELQRRKITSLIQDGVSIPDPASVFIDSKVVVTSGAHIGPQVQLLGNTSIAEGVHIEGCAYIKDTTIASDTLIKFGVRTEGAEIGSHCMVGPFAHLRPQSHLEDAVKVGNFVETKKVHLEKGAKASHLSYLGDAHVGEEANIGAGTITCNYDGYKKSETVIERNAFIGSNSALVAPVTIGAGATVGAGSTITKNVSSDALALTRAAQREVSGWAKKRRTTEETTK